MEFDRSGIVKTLERITIGGVKGRSNLCTQSDTCFAD